MNQVHDHAKAARRQAHQLIVDLGEITYELSTTRSAKSEETTFPCYSAIAHLNAATSTLHQIELGSLTTGQSSIANNVLVAIEMLEKEGSVFTSIAKSLSATVSLLFSNCLSIEGYNLTRNTHVDRVQGVS